MKILGKSTAARVRGQREPAKRERGSTMIEVMVAILILALGMMGMLGMFINSLKISGGSMYRNIATQHAYMMADIIRENMPNIQNYFSPTATTTATCFTAAGCATTAIPNTEYNLWETQLGALLPAGQGVVCRDSIPSNSARITTPTSPAAFMTCDNGTSSQLVVKVCWDESRIRSGNAGITNSSTAGTGGSQCVYTNI